MFIIGCDYHPSVQQIAWVDTGSGECGELRLRHTEAAEQFNRELKKTPFIHEGGLYVSRLPSDTVQMIPALTGWIAAYGKKNRNS
jgi:hypothetical protein